MAILSEAELKEAVREWADRRDLPVTDQTEIIIKTTIVGTQQTTTPSSDNPNYSFQAVIKYIEMLPKDGPYR